MDTNPINKIFPHFAAMKSDEREIFLISMKDKIDRLIDHDVFELVDIDTISKQCKILRDMWSHRRKTTPSGKVYKHKSRICTYGSQLERVLILTKHSAQSYMVQSLSSYHTSTY